MQTVHMMQMNVSISPITVTTEDPRLVPIMTNSDRILYLHELGVPASALATASHHFSAGTGWEMSAPLHSFLDSVLDYYTGLDWSEIPATYSEEWLELRDEVLHQAYIDQAYGF